MKFADVLKSLPPVAHLASLTLRDAQGQEVATIPNQPGKAGSLAVYAALADRHGGRIDAAVAREGLELFAEHAAAAREQPGAHPNIDRLLQVIETDSVLHAEKAFTLPDRLSTDARSPHYVAALMERTIGIVFNGKERFDVEEYCVSEGWVKVPAGKTLDRRGRPLLIKLSGRVEASLKD